MKSPLKLDKYVKQGAAEYPVATCLMSGANKLTANVRLQLFN